MIFAAVGTRLEPFDRFVDALDEAISGLGGQVEGVCQHGTCRHGSRRLESHEAIGREQFQELVATADVVVCHAGVGVLRAALRAGHRPLVMARRAHLGEVLNDHQLEIVRALAAKDLISPFGDAASLRALFAQAGQAGRQPPRSLPPLPAELTRAIARGAKRARPALLARPLLWLLGHAGPTLESMRVEPHPTGKP